MISTSAKSGFHSYLFPRRVILHALWKLCPTLEYRHQSGRFSWLLPLRVWCDLSSKHTCRSWSPAQLCRNLNRRSRPTFANSRNISRTSGASLASHLIFAAQTSNLRVGMRCWKFLMGRRAAIETLLGRSAIRVRFAPSACPIIGIPSRLLSLAIA